MENNFRYKFTVFTSTYNRGHILGRVYESLKKQTFRNFEWIIIDDGSNDDTCEIVEKWINEDEISIRSFSQKNSGKHIAINSGVEKAQGELFLIIDSDDQCVPYALEKFNILWEKIDKIDKKNFSGVFANCFNKKNEIIGTKFPNDIFDNNFIDVFYRYSIKGDKWGFFRTDILKQYPFPVIDQEKFLSEALIWNRISLKFKTRFINEKLLLAEYQSDGLSKNSLKLRVQYPKGTTLYYKEFLALPVPLFWKIRNLINYIRFSFHEHNKISKQVVILTNNYLKFFYFFFLPVGYLFFRRDLFCN